MPTRLEATRAFRRGTLLLALCLAAAEVVLFVLVWRLGILLDPGTDRRAVLAFVLLGSLLTLQAMGVVGFAWTLVALSRTVAVFDDELLRLEHPWREWSGHWTEIRHAWVRGHWLTLELFGASRRWHIRLPEGAGSDVDHLRAHLPPGAWLEGVELRRHVIHRVLPLMLGAIALGGLSLVALMQYLQRALQ
jgi:hypothetical protein